MDAMSKPVGYECEFVDQVPEDYFCKQCKHVAREPNLISCCGEVLCKGCVDLILQDKEPCPSCRDIQVGSQGLHKKYHHKILALVVHCAMKDRGCQWTGQLQHLDAHSHVINGDCQYVDVDCPKQCDQKVQKHNVDTHLADHCPNRDYICQHCNFRDTFRLVSEHFEVCPYYPLACSNRCGVSFERDDLEDHMRMCRLEEVQCVFCDAGCQAKFIRDNEDEHMERNTQKHLALMAATTLKISQDFEKKFKGIEGKLQGKLQEQQQDFQHKQELFEKKLQDKDEQVEQKLDKQSREFQTHMEKKDEQIKALQDFERKLQEQQQDSQHKQEVLEKKLQDKDEQIKTVKEQLQTISQILKQQQDTFSHIGVVVGIPPYDFTLSDYQHLKTRDICHESTPMYTHPNGYKFKLGIFPKGRSSGMDTHVSVYVYSLKSDHDAVLKFPVQFTIILQLLNQYRDQDHYTRDIQCVLKKREEIGRWAHIGNNITFIPNTYLERNADKQTQYLKDDCLRFRVTKIVM